MQIIYYLQALLFLITGLMLGSFFTVLIYRIPKGESIVWPPSHCTRCARVIRWYENIPVVSYLFLGGRCAGCREKISPLYPFVELLTACATMLAWYFIITPFLAHEHRWWEYIVFFTGILSLLILIPVSIIDLYHYIIPDSISLGGLVTGLALSCIPGFLSPVESILGICAGGGSLFMIGYIGSLVTKKEAMGGGDIKLMAFIGSIWGWKIAFYSIIFGALIGAIIGLSLLLAKLLPEDHKIPFGPFLSIGVWVAVFAGDPIIFAYFDVIEKLFG